MRQVVQPPGDRPVEVIEVPRPVIGPAEVLIRTVASVISPGTERAITALSRSSLLTKARARPDLVRQVARKARTDGVATTMRAVRSRLAADLLLGYSAAGVAVEVGDAVSRILPGQLVATGGAGMASHAEFQAVPGLLCAPVPEGVAAQDAAFATIASIPLHALRLADVGPGAKVAVIGLGLIGQLAARLAMAAGCEVAGIDPAAPARAAASRSGLLALDERGDATTAQVLSWTRGRGADAVLVCAATRTSGPVSRAPALCRDRAVIVVVGDVGLSVPRAPCYERELTVRVARSYGPGRYDPSYEEWGVDYPAGHVRWTEGRNAEAVLDLLAAGRLSVADLVTHEFALGDAAAAYRLICERAEPYLAIRLTYPASPAADHPVRLRPAPAGATAPGVGWIGAGAFTTGTLLPAFRDAGFDRYVAVASASGVSARRAAERHGFEKAVSGGDEVIGDPDVGVVVIATPHDVHERLTLAALAAGQHVWCEKPLALTCDGVDEIEQAWRASGRQLTVGFNRRWSPAVRAARDVLAGWHEPKLITYRVAAGRVPGGHWYLDRRQGGRIRGEACHFADTAQALVGSRIEAVTGLLGGRDGSGEAVVAMRFADGSLASIGYTSAAPGCGKEWIEVVAGAHRVVIDDFRAAQADGRTLWKGRQDKGHRAHAAAFRQAVQGKAAMPTEDMLATMRATLRAAQQAAALAGQAGHDG